MRGNDEQTLTGQLLPRAADAVRELCAALYSDGIPVTILQARRTLAQQSANVASGASKTQHSYHLPRVGERGLVRAVDLMWWIGDENARSYCVCGGYVARLGRCPRPGCDEATAKAWRQLGSRAEAAGLFWGGRWTSLDDFGHVHLPGGGAVDLDAARSG